MKIASVDIGTNAVKSKIFKTTPTSMEYIDGIRSPIRLGSDVFKNGKISEKKLNELSKTLQKYQKKLTILRTMKRQIFQLSNKFSKKINLFI